VQFIGGKRKEGIAGLHGVYLVLEPVESRAESDGKRGRLVGARGADT